VISHHLMGRGGTDSDLPGAFSTPEKYSGEEVILLEKRSLAIGGEGAVSFLEERSSIEKKKLHELSQKK